MPVSLLSNRPNAALAVIHKCIARDPKIQLPNQILSTRKLYVEPHKVIFRGCSTRNSQSLTPHTPLPAQTPSQSPPWPVSMLCGAQETLATSYSHRQLADGPLPCTSAWPEPPLPFTVGITAWFCELSRSQTSTRLSSAPEASMPLRLGFHSIVLRLA